MVKVSKLPVGFAASVHRPPKTSVITDLEEDVDADVYSVYFLFIQSHAFCLLTIGQNASDIKPSIIARASRQENGAKVSPPLAACMSSLTDPCHPAYNPCIPAALLLVLQDAGRQGGGRGAQERRGAHGRARFSGPVSQH
ncbi:hypothetical protein ON010_g18961 [Phytophthora cinnamomi]|nr:hypothetical protein ON010_g18961 [Phytophthora cinnamomi]